MRDVVRTTVLALLGAATVAVQPASGQSTPSDVRDLIGARAPGGESQLTARGYVYVGAQTGDDRKWSNWWNARRRVCLSVVTRNGRFDSIVDAPAPDCRQAAPSTLPGSTPSTLPGPVGRPVASGRTEEIRFDRGASSATRNGTIRGYETMSYLLYVRAGQSMSVALRSSNRSGYFNVTAPGANQALFDGSISGDHYRGRVASSGRYKVEVYLMRNAARRNETTRYTLDLGTGR